MRTILIAHRDTDFAEQLAVELRAWGYRVIDCPGPQPPSLRCIRCDKGYCPLSDGADLMIYDPELFAIDDAGRQHNLALDSALAHPDVPMLLAWRSATAPGAETLRSLLAEAPSVRLAAQEPLALRKQVFALVSQAPAIP